MSEHVSDLVGAKEFRRVGEEEIRRLALKYDLTGDFDPFGYVPPGPVAQLFILDETPTVIIMGPLGGGKTTACAFKRIYAATLAPIARHPEDGRPTRMCRWLVLRDTFRSAEKTVLESWKQWFPKGFPGSSWAGGNDRPVTHTLRFIGRDGVRIEAITEFAGLNDSDIETLMKGREYSGVWLNELDTHAEGALDDAEQRVGRYPKKDLLLDPDARRLKFVIGDMNAPTLDNWTYKVLVAKRGPDRAFHQQPSGRSPDAENRFSLEPDYYDRIVRNQDEAFVRRMVDNEFGYSRAGKPVFETFNRRVHVSSHEIGFNSSNDLLVGIDISMNTLNPAAVFGQVQAPGRIAAIDELYLGHGVGAARFGEALNQRLQDRYAGARNVRLYVDPAAEYGADREGGQLAAMETIALICGLPTLIPGNGSNELGLRLDAVKAELRGYLEAGTTLLICQQRCPLLVEGMEGKYRYKRRNERASTEYEEVPEKTHPWADIVDALQYLILGVRGRTAAMRAAAGLPGKGQGSGPWGKGRRTGGAGRGGFDVHTVGR
ncbi:type VI secretion system membrane subunit TssM [Stappia indica]|nr:hypothetical protein [Stappia indica]MCC4243415.1 hypothetical protein [Stappia indica]